MLVSTPIDPIDYLIVGHITCDIAPQGCVIGGTAAYAALTARALGLRVGIVTSYHPDLPVDELNGISIINYPADTSTTFNNIQTGNGRKQIITSQAEYLGFHHIPETWRNTPIIHLAPVAQEVEPLIVRSLSNPILGITMQGWLREWDAEGIVRFCEWPEAKFVLQHAKAAIISIEDIAGQEEIIEEFASACPIFVVTEGKSGTRVYWHGDVRRIRPPEVELVSDVGAGDIFAASFFVRLYTTKDPWEAARFATQLAARSVTRTGMLSIPTTEEINDCMVEVI
jgi:sugar/nucleoside kinase (ribokinase family)